MAGSNDVSKPLSVVTHNTQGLNSPIKRRKALQVYKSLHVDVVFLQETHFPKRYNPTFMHAHYPLFFLAKAENKTKGVAVLFSRYCNFNLIKEYGDPEGRFILIKGTLDEKMYTFVSYYAPNRGQKRFFTQMLDTLRPFMEGIIVMGGDSNLAFDIGLDKSKSKADKVIRPTKISLQVARILHQNRLTDIWRELNPRTKDYILTILTPTSLTLV